MYDYDSIFTTKRFKSKGSIDNISVYYKLTLEIIASVKFIPDPIYPRYEILDKSGHTVGVSLTTSDTQIHLTDVINKWLIDEGLKKQEDFKKTGKVEKDGD